MIALVSGCLLLGTLGASAVATDQPVPPVDSASATPSATPTQDPRAANPTPTPGVPLAARNDSGTQRSYSTALHTVLGNDTCASISPCSTADLTAPLAVTAVPTGWTVRVMPAGKLQVRIPGNNVAGTQAIAYTITDASGTSTATLSIKVTLPKTPDHYNTPQGSKFSRAFVKSSFYRIRRHTLRTINSVPAGSQIRIISWSFSGKAYDDALYAAMKRGVSVQIIMSPPADPKQSDYGHLLKLFGGKRYHKNPDTGSWVYACHKSCRGGSGTMHAKVFLFSQAYNTRWVVMSGSGNMTDYAAQMQWNQQYTTTNNQAIYDSILSKFFLQAKRDTPEKPLQLTLTFPSTTYYFPPLTKQSTTYDFMYQALRQVSCTGARTPGGRTKIRIAMYVWRGNRGLWMAHEVRSLWNKGCDVAIIYSIMGNKAKNVLYSPSGRGRVPMRQTILVDVDHQPIWYLHQKYVAIGGKIGTNPDAFATYQGSFNFSDLGMHSDENFQKLNGYKIYAPYVTDFNQVWSQPETRAPDPNSYVLQEDRQLGTGRYKYMEKD
ncbi:MAG: hypothetical protein JWP74_193 [Marmoricola sp.]|nr:hypothetical protein [Marmoricola sp.]